MRHPSRSLGALILEALRRRVGCPRPRHWRPPEPLRLAAEPTPQPARCRQPAGPQASQSRRDAAPQCPVQAADPQLWNKSELEPVLDSSCKRPCLFLWFSVFPRVPCASLRQSPGHVGCNYRLDEEVLGREGPGGYVSPSPYFHAREQHARGIRRGRGRDNGQGSPLQAQLSQ